MVSVDDSTLGIVIPNAAGSAVASREGQPASTGQTDLAADRRQYFDRYWETRQLKTVDHRTRLRIGIVDRMLTHRAGSLLDVGCGRGCVASYFAERGFDVSAIDLSPMAVEWTKRQHHKIRAAVVDLEFEPIHGRIDVVLCLEMLQQVRDPIKALSKLAAALADGGEIIVSLPNEFHLVRRLDILRGRVNFGGVEDSHIKLFTVAEQRRLLEMCGLTVTKMQTQSIVPPRWGNCRWHNLMNRLSNRFPSLFALSVVYRCVPSNVKPRISR
jgi:2-polyprenyl-3-methyl-5-hydroxy-6-metoxy-1,4-benzoquinol methylase